MWLPGWPWVSFNVSQQSWYSPLNGAVPPRSVARIPIVFELPARGLSLILALSPFFQDSAVSLSTQPPKSIQPIPPLLSPGPPLNPALIWRHLQPKTPYRFLVTSLHLHLSSPVYSLQRGLSVQRPPRHLPQQPQLPSLPASKPTPPIALLSQGAPPSYVSLSETQAPSWISLSLYFLEAHLPNPTRSYDFIYNLYKHMAQSRAKVASSRKRQVRHQNQQPVLKKQGTGFCY